MPTATVTVRITNRLGLHARPAMAFVDAAMAFKADIIVRRTDGPESDAVDGKSIMQMMMLAATKGTELDIIANGDDADAACQSLALLVKSGFDED